MPEGNLMIISILHRAHHHHFLSVPELTISKRVNGLLHDLIILHQPVIDLTVEEEDDKHIKARSVIPRFLKAKCKKSRLHPKICDIWAENCETGD